MPSTYAHCCFGRQVLAALPQKMQAVLLPEQDLFSIGLHGPDILFFDHPLLGRVSRLGHRMHKQSGAAFFRPAGEKLAALEFPAPETAYLYGFLWPLLRSTAPATATLPGRSRAAAWPTRRSRSNLTAACWYRLDWTRSARA